jgi:D-alanyl-D-alanine dipeptidase
MASVAAAAALALAACAPGIPAGERADVAPTRPAAHAVVLPSPPPDSLASLVGAYAAGADTMLVLEQDGRLFRLGRDSARVPLHVLQPDRAAPVGAVLVEREGARVLAIELGARRFERTSAEDGVPFRIAPRRPVSELRELARTAVPPAQPDSLLAPDLVEVATLDPTIRLDVRYATEDNFMGARFYDEPRAFLQRPAAEALVRAHRRLRALGLGVVVYDAYRPWYVTWMFWEATPEHQREFVADPAGGSRHNRGAAVDIGLYDLATGEPVAMPSGYDEFSRRAHSAYPGGTARQRLLRDILRRAMEAEGFAVYAPEWWHFDHGAWRRYPVLNRTFAELRVER